MNQRGVSRGDNLWTGLLKMHRSPSGRRKAEAEAGPGRMFRRPCARCGAYSVHIAERSWSLDVHGTSQTREFLSAVWT